jgi:two-component system OmpR family response regulator
MRATILVIDDDPLIRQVADLVLTQAGYTVASASSGESGLKVAEHTRAQLILLDIQMPDMSGLSVLKVLRRSRRAKIPVMMLTARSDLDTIKAALAAGADGYMVKPFKPADLLRRIDAVLKPAAEAPAPPPSSTSIVLD